MNPLIQWLAQTAMRLFSIVWFRLRAFGLDRIPREGATIVVANHTSHLDPPILGALIRRRKWFLARASLGKFRLGHWFLEKLGVIFIERDNPSRGSMQTAIDCVENGGLLIVFPEGTRSTDGRVGDFRRGVELILRRAKDAVIVPIGLRGPRRAFPRGAIIPRPVRCEAWVGQPIAVRDFRANGGMEWLRHRVDELADVPVAPLVTERTDSSDDAAPGAAASDSLRGTDGPAAASESRRTV
ncbi:MAG: 1-acyl-sn-glycerol-3-phosphate acyltransferase [Planctomycetes bacterium]|nr:1-acyl-sn-glycerol-3-phosphate acyltransferase [Planctomycetota bacterium]